MLRRSTAPERHHIGADMVLAQQFERFAGRRIAVMRKGVQPLLPCLPSRLGTALELAELGHGSSGAMRPSYRRRLGDFWRRHAGFEFREPAPESRQFLGQAF